jgi:heme/copper-type cytochrome/quinol oxidase subunit 4
MAFVRCNGSMSRLVFWIAVLTLAGLAAPARGESIYRYRDPTTKREVFVTRLEQVPAEYRAQAKLVVSDGVLVDSTAEPDQNAPRGTVIYGSDKPAGVLETITHALSEVRRGGLDAGGLYRTFAVAIDTVRVRQDKPPLSAAQVAQGKRLLVEATVGLTVSSLLSLLALILVIAHAFRAQHRWWIVFMLLFPPLGITYVLIHVEGERRWFKFATLFAQAAPYVVAMATAWRFVALFSG